MIVQTDLLHHCREGHCCVANIDSVLDKCVLMDLTVKGRSLYASVFPNCKEPE